MDNQEAVPKASGLRKEVIGILFLFLVLFLAGSLLSYSPGDFSWDSAGGDGEIHNFFGVVGAWTAGPLIVLFGMGAFWLPVLFFFAGDHLIKKSSGIRWAAFGLGSVLLIITTGALLSLMTGGGRVSLFGKHYYADGIVGGQFESILSGYLNPTGAGFVLATLWIVSFIAATGISVVRTAAGLRRGLRAVYHFIQSRILLWWGRRKKARMREENKERIARVTKPKKPPRIKKAPKKPVEPPARQEVFEFMKEGGEYALPPVSLLDDPAAPPESADQKNLLMQARLLEKKLEDFGVQGRVVEVSPGPVITTFEYEPAPGVKINRITNLSNDLAMALRALSVRISGPIPGKAAVGIEVPNSERELVGFKEIVSSTGFSGAKSKLTLCLGKDVVGAPVVSDLAKMPHLLIAGATGSGKSVALNTMISSLLYRCTPDDLKFVMIDPKRIELSTFDGIPHLICPVVTDAKKATNALFWAVREMEARYEAMAMVGARNISTYNQKVAKILEQKKNAPPPAEGEESAQAPEEKAPEPRLFPLVVIVIDELADLMMVASRDVEVSLARLAQMARAAGMHMILATQRPSVDVLTGTIKANFPTRVAFQVSSRTDSRTIIDGNGAEDLLGRGDMLFMPPGAARLQRLHGAYISDEELARVLSFIRQQSRPQYDTSVTEAPAASADSGGDDDDEYDERYDEAVAIVTETRQASISGIQRRLRIGYNRAARIIEKMEREGVVGPSDGVKPREVLVPGYSDD